MIVFKYNFILYSNLISMFNKPTHHFILEIYLGNLKILK